jgi:hypothetical protein
MFGMVLTRPDIAFTLGKLSQYMSDPAEHHGHALKNLLRHLRSTVTIKQRYGPGGPHSQFIIYHDADWASDIVDQRTSQEALQYSMDAQYHGLARRCIELFCAFKEVLVRCSMLCIVCVVLLLSLPNALQTFVYYHSAPCPSAFRHIPEMLYYNTTISFNIKLRI